MRELKLGSTNYTRVFAGDRSIGNASHQYYICRADEAIDKPAGEFGSIQFQTGGVKDAGVNGCHNEDLLIIVLDRLQSFQDSDFKCRENAFAINKIEEALHWLKNRTEGRQRRGVEGTAIV